MMLIAQLNRNQTSVCFFNCFILLSSCNICSSGYDSIVLYHSLCHIFYFLKDKWIFAVFSYAADSGVFLFPSFFLSWLISSFLLRFPPQWFRPSLWVLCPALCSPGQAAVKPVRVIHSDSPSRLHWTHHCNVAHGRAPPLSPPHTHIHAHNHDSALCFLQCLTGGILLSLFIKPLTAGHLVNGSGCFGLTGQVMILWPILGKRKGFHGVEFRPPSFTEKSSSVSFRSNTVN